MATSSDKDKSRISTTPHLEAAANQTPQAANLPPGILDPGKKQQSDQRERIRGYIQHFNFRDLFIEELGWNHFKGRPTDVEVLSHLYSLQPLAEKHGLAVYLCASPLIPDYASRRQIEQKARPRLVREHLIIFVDKGMNRQVWQWVRRERGKTEACREHPYYRGQSAEALVQRLPQIAFDLNEEEVLTIVPVAERVREAFDTAPVTKRFYDRFKTEQSSFLAFIQGIPGEGERKWYASLMLNRLMFTYFIQKKGFLAGDVDYLPNRLHLVRQRYGQDQFHSFYRSFLLRLFHDGLGQRAHSPELVGLIGTVPYLNGGLFEPHRIEQDHPNIEIPDEAFARIFAFFDEYHWHLDERPLRADNEINPDVLGYIFEKYINQKQMGAYYTKEDITGYISKNTIIPFLFEATQPRCPIAFEPGGEVWRLLRDDPNRYLYEPVLKGVDLDLLPEIGAGINDITRREGWNRAAAADYALPTETWREHIVRRTRCQEVRAKLATGAIVSINDLITYNLDIERFAQDMLERSEGPELLRAFWRSIEQVSVLDPTCGSGAFLFAALNLLEPLYEACLDRMQAFVDEADRTNQARHFPDFRAVLTRVAQHPNRRYFILKSIIINNLYGVDIMEEAVEIARLRLFLKLVAQVEDVSQIEPLPDIDFNIRAGNTLVGYATYAEVQRAVTSKFDFDDVMERIEQKASDLDRLFEQFRAQQTTHGGVVEREAKEELRHRLSELADELDRYLAAEYGLDERNIQNAKERAQKLLVWRAGHQPFHWFIEFYGIVHKRGGFDVIIGNPPWKEYSAVRRDYTVRGYTTEPSGNLYALCAERSLHLRSQHGWLSFIVQLPLASSSRMNATRSLLKEQSRSLFVIPFGDRPGKLFEGLQNCRSVIFLSQGKGNAQASLLATSRYHRWPSEAREYIFPQLQYTPILGELIYPGQFPKYAAPVEEALFRKVKAQGGQVVGMALSTQVTGHFIFYQEATQYWVKATVGLPYYAKNGVVGAPAHGRYLYFDQEQTAHVVCALLNSSLFYSYFIANGDCFHLSDTLVSGFPATARLLGDTRLIALNKALMDNLRDGAERTTIRTKDGDEITYAEFYARKSKPIIDEIDSVLAQHYSFTDEELDFIINYDIKYRMGQSGDEGDDEA